ncbi:MULTISPECIES: anti-sigma factor family protein [Mycobacteriaceae]|uniref:Zf-HC2 domain-containing protein n=2 Tax=Mycobacteriaceae TaxID=1762 RepID=A0AAE4VK18_MYCFO|nr:MULTISPECIES: zf-HC2 domain-containing protein [Mycobacteriaceae]ATO61698.1 zf-HC2 domain-containing protein [Mycobacterium avium subsp. hominissuis]MCA4736562.1 zf-HC2 domain-containing protein [Mycobacterium avium subsp. hominissuis]MCA4741156.1 zf-HC2 domain-containing protein [Mycobacterium avium subsp. hominissuis]MCA4745756.1 zf-HC2 domain-containing protein [Mycobacterium avium subsp. hominissuis]MCA4765973.1 zf-HC2 domain-containing protein [Mycobacterium avium subsp. hominissuis]
MSRPHRLVRAGLFACRHIEHAEVGQGSAQDNGVVRCQEFVELVTDYLDDSLDAPARQRLDGHLDDCAPCSAYLEQFRFTIAAIARVENPPVDALRSRLLAAFSVVNDRI